MEKHKTKILIGAFSLFFFLFGISVGVENCPQCENKIITKETIKEVKISNEDYDLLKIKNQELKQEIKIRTQIIEVDNKALSLGADGINLCADGIIAAYYRKTGTMESINAKTEILTSNMNKLANQKIKLLLQLEK